MVEDLAAGGRRRRLRVVPDTPAIRSAVESARRVTHDRIVGVHRAEPSEDGRLLIVTDPIEGESLAGRLLRLGPLHETVIVRLMTAIARGLDQAHAMGVVHGALDAGAVLVGEDGDAMLLGLAVDAAVRSPESMSAGSTGEDVRAFAAILLHALNGEPPARSANVDDIAAWTTRSEEADDPPLRRGIRRAALRGLEHDSDRRPRTCGELMAGIDAAVGAIAAGSSGPSADPSGVGTDGEKRYQTPLDLLELESELAEIVPRKSRLRLPEHDAIRSRWEKGEHFLSSGGVYKQLQHWEPAGKALGQAAGEFRAALALDRGLATARETRARFGERLVAMRWPDHPACRESRARIEALLDEERGRWPEDWEEGRLDGLESTLAVVSDLLHEASFLNRAVASAAELRDAWSRVTTRVPDRTHDARYAEEIRDHTAAGQRGEAAFERGDFDVAGGIWAARVDRLGVVLGREHASHDATMAARQRFDDAISRAPKSRPISTVLRQALDALLAESDRVENELVATGRFVEATAGWSEAAASIGGLVQDDVARFGRMETAREAYETSEAAGRPARRTWSRLAEEFEQIRGLAARAAADREGGEFAAATEAWTAARERLERAFPLDVERHREAILACERYDRRVASIPQRVIDRSVRADLARLTKRRVVLGEWMAAGRFSEVEETVRRAVESIDKLLEIDARLHDAAIGARDRAATAAFDMPSEVPEDVHIRMKPAAEEIDAAVVQARQAFELGEYADCAEAWQRSVELRRRFAEDLHGEVERHHRQRRRAAMLRTAGVLTAAVLLLAAGAELGARWWVGSVLDRVTGVVSTNPAIEARRDGIRDDLDRVLARPLAVVPVATSMSELLDRLDALEADVPRSEDLQRRIAAVPILERDPGHPAALDQVVATFIETRTRATDLLAAGDLDATAATLGELDGLADLPDRMRRAIEVRTRIEEVAAKRPAEASSFSEIQAGWEAFDTQVEAAEVGYAANDLDAATESLDVAMETADRLELLALELAAIESRRRFELVWEADEMVPIRAGAFADDLDRIERLSKTAATAFAGADFEAARDSWDEALERATKIRNEVGGELGEAVGARAAWADRDRPVQGIRDDPKFRSRFDGAEGRADSAARKFENGEYANAAVAFRSAFEDWNTVLGDAKAEIKLRWAGYRDPDREVSDRLRDAEWLARILEAGTPAQQDAETVAERLRWITVPPVPGQKRRWPLSADRSIVLVFVPSTSPFMVGPAGTGVDAPVSVGLTGFWISERPVDHETLGLAGTGSVVESDVSGPMQHARGLGSVETIRSDDDPRRGTLRFRLPTEAEWLLAEDRGAIGQVSPRGEWCRDRFVRDRWWLHLRERNPGGPSTGDPGVIRLGPEDRRPAGEGREAGFRVVLSSIDEPVPMTEDELAKRLDPRLAGETQPGRETRDIRIGGVIVRFVKLPVGPGRDDLWVATTETTQALWKAVMGSLPGNQIAIADNLPVGGMSLYEARDFCQKVRANTPGIRVRLPKASEWTLAARAGGDTPFCFGGREHARYLPEFAWITSNAGGRPRPVGTAKPNWWWLHDVHGNVEEWTDTDDSTPNVVPVFGGHAGSSPSECEIDRPRLISPVFQDSRRGFRLVADDLPSP